MIGIYYRECSEIENRVSQSIICSESLLLEVDIWFILLPLSSANTAQVSSVIRGGACSFVPRH